MTDDLGKAIYNKVCKLETLLTGNGTPEKGLIVRVDRLEQHRQFIAGVVWFLAGALLAPEIILACFYLLGKS